MISFVIPAHNEQELIAQSITAIRQAAEAEKEPYEIIVVNDSSNDATASIARKLEARVVDVDHRQIAATRNSGAKNANGDILIFVDADTFTTPSALCSALSALRHGAVGGGCRVRFDPPYPFYAWVLQQILTPFLHLLRLAPGCFVFCTRQAYLDSGGFDESLFCTEEVAFAGRLKQLGRFVILREFVVTSPRKLRTRNAFQLMYLGLRIGLTRRKSARQRDQLDYWYGPRE